MNTKKLIGLSIVILVFIIGCAGTNGRIIAQKSDKNKVTLMEIRDNWGNYDIYYGKRTPSYADAIMFDPKNNSTKLSGDSWIKIEEQNVLDEKIAEIQIRYNNADIRIIVGRNNQIFGYMYSSDKGMHVGIKTVDEQTLYIMPLPPPRSPR